MAIIDSRRNFLKFGVDSGLVALAASAGLLPSLVFALGNVPTELPTGKSIYELRGTVLIDGQQATMDSFITANSVVETGSNSYIIFVVGKDAHILRENSQLHLSGNGVIEAGLRVLTGKVLSVFGERKKSDDTFNIKTSTATIGIRGTAVYIESWDDYSYLCTCYGKTQVTSLTDPKIKETIITKHHDSPRFIYKNPQKGKIIEIAPVKNHTDEELMLIEAIVGRTVPFSAVQGYGGPRRSY